MSTTQRPTPRTYAAYQGLSDESMRRTIKQRTEMQRIERELAEAQTVVKACMAAMPVGNIKTHTPENLADRISDLALALARETNENEAMRAAIQEANTVIERYSESAISHAAQLMCPECLRIEAFDEEHKDTCSIGKSLAALKPFLPESPCQPGE